jgi:glucoamylase
MNNNNAPGQPGLSPRWTTSQKEGVGTSHNTSSRVWFTLSHGILDEIYYPRVDSACTRDMGMIVTDGKEFFSEEKRNATSKTRWMASGVPAFEIVNTCKEGRYEIHKQILSDPNRHVVLQQTQFIAKKGKIGDYHLYVLLAPHLHNFGEGNIAWLGDYKGIPMLMAERDGAGLALACSEPWLKRSAGFVGASDGWQDLHTHKKMEWEYERAEKGNVALTGEIPISSNNGKFLLALGFGRNAMEAAHRARASLIQGFDAAWKQYRREWETWQKTLRPLDSECASGGNLYRASTAIISTHEAEDFPGGTIASLSIPWGSAHGDNDIGGYHLVWPRDGYEACGAMIAAGAHGDARRALNYFEVTQEADGHWPQNMWLDGSKYWKGIQIDETAAPILLLDLARREHMLGNDGEMDRLWPMVRKAAIYIVKNGPATEQDRWEEDCGFSPFTLASVIAALLVAADLAPQYGEAELGEYLRQTADAWNDSIDDWIYATNTELARKTGVEGYYIRITPTPLNCVTSPDQEMVSVKNRPEENSRIPASQLVSPDALALVRFGLRPADDPRILNTIKVIDSMLKIETPGGPSWHRYNNDGYGEHEDGAAFDGVGIGRAWPLLTGERAHYELAAGNKKEAQRLMSAMEAFADQHGMIPEQIWDSADILKRELFFGRPSGSARPLVWAHAEYIKLLRSLKDGCVFDQPPQTVRRYLEKKVRSAFAVWRFSCQSRTIRQGRRLRIETVSPARVHWTDDNWTSASDVSTRDTGFGIHVADLPTEQMPLGAKIIFTFFWPDSNRWEGINFTAEIVADSSAEPAKPKTEKNRDGAKRNSTSTPKIPDPILGKFRATQLSKQER